MAEKNKKRVKQKAQGKPVPETVNETQEEKPEMEERSAAEDKRETALPEPFEFVLPEKAKEPEDAEAESILKTADHFLSNHKAVLTLSSAIVTCVLLIIFYCYRAGQLLFFRIDDNWNTFADKGILYKLALPACIGILFLGILCIYVMRVSYSVTVITEAEKKLIDWAWKSTIVIILKFCFFAGAVLSNVYALNNLNLQEPKIYQIFTGMVLAFFFGIMCYFVGIRLKKKGTAKKENIIINVFIIAIELAFMVCAHYLIGYNNARTHKEFSFICLEEEKPSPPTDKIQDINILCPVTTTATTDNTMSMTITTDTTVSTTDATTTTTASIDIPGDVPVYVILAENKDNYLAAAGMVRPGGLLDLDRDCQIILEKKNQIVLKKTFTEVNVDYIFDYQFEEEVTP